MVNGNAEIRIIQGDSYQKNVVIRNWEELAITKVYLSCKCLNICRQLEFDTSVAKWVFYLTADETKDLREIVTDYDITIVFTDGNVKTVSYEAKFMVFEKKNKVGCLENDA